MEATMKKLVVAVFALALFALVVEIGIVPAHYEPSWPVVAAATAAIPTFGGAFTIREFCKAHRISEAFYYRMKNEGWAPDEMHAGARTLISFESAAKWRREREAAAAAGMRRKVESTPAAGSSDDHDRVK
jgi:hypothetical protein